ncbi:MAG: carbamoyltransferase HypF [Candidatus Obscuribacterales bacterium]|nr:carbamoyltransferase HypF [Candidatus Obscuribacterales bacterium]
MKPDSDNIRKRITVTGLVQGVGFRPFIYRLAKQFGLSGFVQNRGGVVIVEAQGASPAVAAFQQNIAAQAPPLSHVASVVAEDLAFLQGNEGGDRNAECFVIVQSDEGDEGRKQVPPDSATCAECLKEVLDPSERRYRYPFTNCTNCGPRFTIIESLPYDRKSTSMQEFKMCQACAREFEDPADRRFHAQPIACAACGPRLSWKSEQLEAYGEEALVHLVQLLCREEIVAVKGLGGYHLMTDARSVTAIERLRQRKRRHRKPFAVMMRDLEMVRLHCKLNEVEARELSGAACPIVLLERRADSTLPSELAPGLDRIGVMLPYTPLHHLIIRDFSHPLVATSGNMSEEPIVIANSQAVHNLGAIARGFLEHNRPILSRYDDSIVQCIGQSVSVLRRARGMAPSPLLLPFESRKGVLACGAQLKNTFCLLRKELAYVSHHIGDLFSIESHDYFMELLQKYVKLFDLSYDVIACDKHPDYLSTAIAETLSREKNLPLVRVQHHHAHMVSCMVDNGQTGKIIGVVFDGSGYGDDETLWGGEFLIGSYESFVRVGHLKMIALTGGDASVREPWRMALSYVIADGDSELYEKFTSSLICTEGKERVGAIRSLITSKFASPMTSSCGRLFDAVSAVLGVCLRAEFEGQAAMELEAVAHSAVSAGAPDPRSYSIALETTADGLVQVDTVEIFRQVWSDFCKGADVARVALRFHCTIAEVVVSVCEKLRMIHGINHVTLSGGVFQNRLLLGLSSELLRKKGFQVFYPQSLPSGDGGLSLGQAVVASATLNALNFDCSGGV